MNIKNSFRSVISWFFCDSLFEINIEPDNIDFGLRFRVRPWYVFSWLLSILFAYLSYKQTINLMLNGVDAMLLQLFFAVTVLYAVFPIVCIVSGLLAIVFQIIYLYALGYNDKSREPNFITTALGIPLFVLILIFGVFGNLFSKEDYLTEY